MLQSDKGLSSVRLAEALGVSQPTAWRMGHAIRLLTAQEHLLDGTVETDHFYLGGNPPKKRNVPPPGRGRKEKKKTAKTPILSMVQRPQSTEVGSPVGHARASVVADLSAVEASRVFGQELDLQANLMSDDWTAFAALGHNFSDHQTVNHSKDEYVRGAVHINSSEGFSSRDQTNRIRCFSSYQHGPC
uniref:IS1595 family transposase n=1 Tax=Pseudovibrio sp. W64 TaxID=1735583 RepID=UPI00315D1DC1